MPILLVLIHLLTYVSLLQVGYLHLTDPDRLHQLMLHLGLGFRDGSGGQS